MRPPAPACGPAHTSLRLLSDCLCFVDRWSGAELSHPKLYHLNSVLTRTRRKVLSELRRQLYLASVRIALAPFLLATPHLSTRPCYPDCRLRPAFVNYPQPLGVRQYETSKVGSSSKHATPLLQYLVRLISQTRS